MNAVVIEVRDVAIQGVAVSESDLVGAASVYRLGKGWLEQLRADTNDESIRLAAANGDGKLTADFVVSSVER